MLRELEWDTHVNACRIGFAAKDGSVALTADVASFTPELAAAEAAQRFRGVRAVADDQVESRFVVVP